MQLHKQTNILLLMMVLLPFKVQLLLLFIVLVCKYFFSSFSSFPFFPLLSPFSPSFPSHSPLLDTSEEKVFGKPTLNAFILAQPYHNNTNPRSTRTKEKENEKEKQQESGKKEGGEREKGGERGRPSIFTLLVDSAAGGNWDRRMPLTNHLLQMMQESGDFSVYRFHRFDFFILFYFIFFLFFFIFFFIFFYFFFYFYLFIFIYFIFFYFILFFFFFFFISKFLSSPSSSPSFSSLDTTPWVLIPLPT